jgi:hypothetical protein
MKKTNHNSPLSYIYIRRPVQLRKKNIALVHRIQRRNLASTYYIYFGCERRSHSGLVRFGDNPHVLGGIEPV